MSAVFRSCLSVIPVAALVIGLGPNNVFSQIAIFFSKMAMVTFGGAFAVLAYVAQQAAEYYDWVSPREMSFGFSFDAPVLSSMDVPALVLSIAAATTIFRFNFGMLTVLGASCIVGALLRLTGII
jgi:hypothetical protein